MRLARHHSALAIASLLTVLAFVGATAYTQRQLVAVDALSSTIESNAAPSVEHLGHAGVRLERVRLLLRDGLNPGDAHARTLDDARAELRTLEGDIEKYLELKPLPGEGALWGSTRHELDHAVRLAHKTIQAEEHGEASATTVRLQEQADLALDHAASTVLKALQFDVDSSERLAREVSSVRRRTTKQIVVLDILATAFAVAAGFVAFRASREHDVLQRRHNTLLEERVRDLDRFAGRVAHDVLSPLDAVGFALALAKESPGQRDYLDRAQRSVLRVKQLVDGLLAFSRAGSDVGPDATSRVDLVFANVRADWSAQADAMGVTLVVEPCEQLEVPCSPGVLTSMVQNLVSNAIKYIGAAPTRLVALRARSSAGRVLIEVADTGPGIPADTRAKIFDPFVRGDHPTIAGLGLGLATVKRLVDGHGGTIDVESSVGVGTVFRINLPELANEARRGTNADGSKGLSGV